MGYDDIYLLKLRLIKIMTTRIFYIEPFLIKPERHFIETSLAIYYRLSKQNVFQFFIVGNKNLAPEVKDLIPDVVPAISQMVFEDLENKGSSFFEDLVNLDKIYHFTPEDFLIVPTAYENQIIAIKKFAKYKRRLMPKVAIQIHVLFPPVKDSNDVLKSEFRVFWRQRLKDAFRDVPPSVSIWTTESKQLNKDYKAVSGLNVGMLPVPYLMLISNLKKKRTESIRIGFLGEGRQEKGLHLFLKAIEEINKQKNSFSFFIQNNNPRGFSDKELNDMLALLEKVKRYKNIEVVDGGIPPVEYHGALLSLDCVVLPHNPANYCRRVSGILIQASMYNIPSIVSSGTEEEISIRNGKTKGLVFSYDINSISKTIENLVKALKKFATAKDSMSKTMLPSIEHLRKHNSAANYLSKIMSPYPELRKVAKEINKTQ